MVRYCAIQSRGPNENKISVLTAGGKMIILWRNSKMTFNANSFRGSNLRSDVLFFLAGGAIGAATALLFAPKPGVDLRHDIADAGRKGYDETLTIAKRLRNRTETLIDSASTKLRLVSGPIEDKMDQVREVMDDPLIPLAEVSPTQTRAGNSGRRSSSIL